MMVLVVNGRVSSSCGWCHGTKAPAGGGGGGAAGAGHAFLEVVLRAERFFESLR